MRYDAQRIIAPMGGDSKAVSVEKKKTTNLKFSSLFFLRIQIYLALSSLTISWFPSKSRTMFTVTVTITYIKLMI
jgi:hypothetical protein